MAKQLGIKTKSNKPFGLDNLITGIPEAPSIQITEVQPSALNRENVMPTTTEPIEEEIIESPTPEVEAVQEESNIPTIKKVGRPKTSTKTPKRSAEIGTVEGEMRYTAIVNEELLETVKKIAYWERMKMKDMFNLALESFIEEYKLKFGEIKEIPTKKKLI